MHAASRSAVYRRELDRAHCALTNRFGHSGRSQEYAMSDQPNATLYRMVLPDHVCPFGVRAKQLLEDKGYRIDEHILHTRAEVDAFEAEHGVQTTPQVFIAGERIGGSDELAAYLAAK